MSSTSSNVMVVPLTKFAGVTIPLPPSVFIEIILICPSTPSANEKACDPPVVISNVTVSVKFMTSVLPEPVSVCTPKTFPREVKVPSTVKPSLMFTVEESAALIVVPFNVSPAAITDPVPPGVILIFEFEDEVIFASCIVKLSMLVVVSVVTPLTPVSYTLLTLPTICSV